MHKILQYLASIIFRDVYKKTIKQVFDEQGISANKKLAATLTGQLGDIGVLPDECDFLLFTGLHLHYMIGGSCYPKKGSMEMVKGVASTIIQLGGLILVKAAVNQILIKSG